MITAYQLREYQREAIEAVEHSWADGITRPVIVLPTGVGKSLVIAGFVDRHIERLRKEGLRILVLAHREELLEQNEAKIKALVPGVWTAVVKGSRGVTTHRFADVIVASVQTLARPKRREAVDRIGMIIVDECHLYGGSSKSYLSVLDHYGCRDERATRTVGLTATLTRMDGGLPDVWQAVAYEKKITWFIERGFLVPPVAQSIEVPGLNFSRVRITAGDLNSKDVAEALADAEAFKIMAEKWEELAADRPTIAFMPDVATCHQLAEAVNARGARAEVVTGETISTDRKAAYARFTARETHMLVSAQVLTTGFDAPLTSCVLIGRPTKSPGLFVQMVGRGLRPAPDKDDCLVLDLAGASLSHSLAGVNDLDVECPGVDNCGCECYRCGCSAACKCLKRQCGCPCIEQHERRSRDCKCVGRDDCSCGCPGDQGAEGHECLCDDNPECECRSGPEQVEVKEVEGSVLRTLTQVDILGTELKKSAFSWLTTPGGIKALPTGQNQAVFLLPAPEGGYFQGLLDGLSQYGKVTRMDSGALPVQDALKALEGFADESDFTYNNKRASWRRGPASDAQLRVLTGMRVPVPDGCRKGEAADLITTHKIASALDHRFAKYVR